MKLFWLMMDQLTHGDQNFPKLRGNPKSKYLNIKKFGKGQALKTGIENSSGETIVFMDGDLQDDPKDLPKVY